MTERAVDLFTIENREGRSGLVRNFWRTKSVDLPSFMSIALPTWQIVFVIENNGSRSVVARGPETFATRSAIPKDAEIFGIEFELGTFLTGHPVGGLVDAAQTLALRGPNGFWLNEAKFEIPCFDNADVFIDRLVRSGALVRDPVIEQTLQREAVDLSDRSIQRRFVRATGLTFATIRQIERVRHAADRLAAGSSILDVVDDLGYSDQSHLTRSLKRYVGTTPGRLGKLPL